MGAHIVARVGEIDDGASVIVELEGRSIGVFNVQGTYYALHNSCAHQSGPVCSGKLFPTLRARVEPNGKVKEYFDHDTVVVACPWHGWEFEVATGVCAADRKRKLRTYETVVEGDNVLVIV